MVSLSMHKEIRNVLVDSVTFMRCTMSITLPTAA